jgi:hypothetical protein
MPITGGDFFEHGWIASRITSHGRVKHPFVSI